MSSTFASLFSGCGGLDWGFAVTEFQPTFAVELLKDPTLTLAKNLNLNVRASASELSADDLPVAINADVRAVDFARFRGIDVDVLVGGAPCQDFSIAKAFKRQGVDGRRGALYLEFSRALGHFQPKVFVFENVVGLLSANQRQAFDTILGALQSPANARFGYDVLYANVVNSAHVGVPQSRQRLIVVGVRADLARSIDDAQRKRFAQSLEALNSPFFQHPLTALEALEGGVLVDLQARYRDVVTSYEPLVDDARRSRNTSARRWAQTMDSFKQTNYDVVRDYHTALGVPYDKQTFDQAMRAHEALLGQLGWLNKPVASLKTPDNVTPKQKEDVTERLSRIPFGENASFVDGTSWQVANNGISLIYRRLHPLLPSPTVVAYGGGGTYGYHYDRARAQLTLREKARLQSFPDTYTFCGTNVRAQIGEAVPPWLSRHIARVVRDLLAECRL